MKVIIDFALLVFILLAIAFAGLVGGFVYGVYRSDAAAKKEAGKDGFIVIDRSDGEFNFFANLANDPRQFKNGQIVSLEVADITNLPISASSQEKQRS